MKLLIVLSAFFFTIFFCDAQNNSWQKMDFPQQYPNWVESICISSNGSIFAGTHNNGLMRSTDNGDTWKEILMRTKYYGDKIQIAITTAGVIFAIVENNLLRSTDNGSNWTSVGLASWGTFISGLTINSNDNIFISGFTFGIYRSTDQGNSWSVINNGLNTIYPRGVMITPKGSNQTLYLYGDNSNSSQDIYRSTDAGNLWTLCSSPTSYLSDIYIHSNSDIYGVSNSGDLYRSTNKGDSWQIVHAFTLNYSTYFPMLPLSDGNILGRNNYDSKNIYCSADGGYNWTVADTLNISHIFCMASNQNGSLYMATQYGMYRKSNNISPWQPCNTGFPNFSSQITSITGKTNGLLFAGTTIFGNFTSSNFGQSWSWNTPGYYSFVPSIGISRLVAHPNGSIFLAGSDAPRLAVSNDNGNHWIDLLMGGHDLGIDNNGIIYSCGAYPGIYRSSDGGNAWTPITCGGESLPRMHVTKTGTLVVLTTYTTGLSRPQTHYITRTSTNGGSTWILAALAIGNNDTYPTTEYTSTNNGYLFAATTGGMFRSINSGQSWDLINSGLISTYVRSLTTNSLDILFCGTNSNGVFRSTDYGNHWEPFSNGLTDTMITSLYCDNDGYLFAGGWNQGIFKTTLTTSVSNIGKNPISFSLEQNYPNPFNPSTVISFTIPFQCFVTLKVYNILGNEITALNSGYRNQGSYTETWNAISQPSGIYFYSLSAGNFKEVKKMLLIK